MSAMSTHNGGAAAGSSEPRMTQDHSGSPRVNAHSEERKHGHRRKKSSTISKSASKDSVSMLSSKSTRNPQKSKRNAWLRAALHNDIQQLRSMVSDTTIDVNVADRAGRTALLLASFHGFSDYIQTLLKLTTDRGLDINAPTCDQATPLIVSAFRGHAVVVDLLLQAKAEVNRQDSFGATALHYASAKGHEQVVDLLLASNADPLLQDSDGLSALERAHQVEHLRSNVGGPAGGQHESPLATPSRSFNSVEEASTHSAPTTPALQTRSTVSSAQSTPQAAVMQAIIQHSRSQKLHAHPSAVRLWKCTYRVYIREEPSRDSAVVTSAEFPDGLHVEEDEFFRELDREVRDSSMWIKHDRGWSQVRDDRRGHVNAELVHGSDAASDGGTPTKHTSIDKAPRRADPVVQRSRSTARDSGSYPLEHRSQDINKAEVNDLFASAVRSVPLGPVLVLDSRLFVTSKILVGLPLPPLRIDIPNPFDYKYMADYVNKKPDQLPNVHVHDAMFADFIQTVPKLQHADDSTDTTRYTAVWLDEQTTLAGSKKGLRKGIVPPAHSIVLMLERHMLAPRSVFAVTVSNRQVNVAHKLQALNETLAFVTSCCPQYGYYAAVREIRTYSSMSFALFDIYSMNSPGFRPLTSLPPTVTAESKAAGGSQVSATEAPPKEIGVHAKKVEHRPRRNRFLPLILTFVLVMMVMVARHLMQNYGDYPLG